MTTVVTEQRDAFSRFETRLETPYFSMDSARIRHNVATLRAALPCEQLYYAVKANPEPAVLEVVAGEHTGFEIASAYEMSPLRDLGVSPERVHYGTAIKPSSHIRAAHRWGVTSFAADSHAEVVKIAAAAPRAQVFIRVRVDDSESAFAFGEKFGCGHTEAIDLVLHARSLGLVPAGLSFHVGSQAVRTTAWADALRSLAPILERLRSEGEPETLNIGGGFPVQYAEAAAVPSPFSIGAAIRAALPDLPPVRLVAEPGRFLVADAATLTTTVIARTSRDEAEWLFVDGGCYNGLFEAMPYQGRTRYPVTTTGSLPHGGSVRRFNIAGPTGDSADVIARDVLLPDSLVEGDTLTFLSAGAYTTSLSVPFNGFPRPEVHMT